MNKIVNFILIIGGILLMQGCASHANFVKKYNAWVGHDMSELIAQVGYPDSTYTLPNKNKVYVYERSRVYSVPNMIGYGGYYGGYGGYYGGMMGYGFGYSEEIVQESCKLFIETNRKNIIVRWRSRGNSCVSDEPQKPL